MRRITFSALLTVLFIPLTAGTIGAQSEIRWHETPRVGIAVEDAASAPLVNLAAVGVGNSAGLGWSGYYDGAGNPDNTFHASLGLFSYALRRFEGVNDHEIGLGFPITDGMYLGSGVRWIPGDGAGVNVHMLCRPADWLSVGVKGESLNQEPWMDFGAALRPLMFSDYWRSRCTLFYDGRVNPSGGYDNIAAGLRASPIDGIELYGHWDFRYEKMVTGVNFSWNRLMTGGEITALGDQALSEGNAQLFVSAENHARIRRKPEDAGGVRYGANHHRYTKTLPCDGYRYPKSRSGPLSIRISLGYRTSYTGSGSESRAVRQTGLHHFFLKPCGN